MLLNCPVVTISTSACSSVARRRAAGKTWKATPGRRASPASGKIETRELRLPRLDATERTNEEANVLHGLLKRDLKAARKGAEVRPDLQASHGNINYP